MISALLTIISYSWQAWTNTLVFNEKLIIAIQDRPDALIISLVILFAAGVSQTVSQSIILFLNQVSKGRFLVSLIIGGLLSIIAYTFWTVSIWVIARWVFETNETFTTAFRVLALGQAPLVLSIVTIIPYAGTALSRILHIWTFLLVLFIIEITFHLTSWQSIVCAGLGWALFMFFQFFSGPVIDRVQRLIWKHTTGRPLDVTAHKMIEYLEEQLQNFLPLVRS
jgi:hypothetical protein